MNQPSENEEGYKVLHDARFHCVYIASLDKLPCIFRTRLCCFEQVILLMLTFCSFMAQEMVGHLSNSCHQIISCAFNFSLDNVHFQNTAQLVEALTEADVLFDMQVSCLITCECGCVM